MPESRETIGQRLRQLRLSRKISIEQAADATRIRVQYLQALEADNYSAMASAAQGRGFLRMYASYLNLDLEAAMQELRESGAEIAAKGPAEPVYESPVPAPMQTAVIPAPEQKPASKPFWTRLLKKAASESSQAMVPPAETTPEIPAETQPEPVQVLEPSKEPSARPADKKKESKKPRLKSQSPTPSSKPKRPRNLK